MRYVNPSTLTEQIARQTRRSSNPLRRRDVEQVLTLFLGLVAEELSKADGRVNLSGVGILEVQQFRIAGRLKDIRTSDPITITDALRYRVRFKSSIPLKQALRNTRASELDISID